ncbi:hypothetical protein XO12_07835 [Marinitoga sp. 1154]|uniref:type III-B CRISPR-associated protein Cas10/Cmr2 n=1 Tax=Marinitoga sp. 1154 TaxID=1643335 RepID=UPI0015862A2C|nr:type III-B CRISPR-associated protein Cas10/Cmr2 [Marinitoga sp. 1154]NUV00003.1 hypothetical protein [Marinitoga sp. 1154]
MNNNYLFLFTIGPVQSFIAEARKTKDLYEGSKLLSNLIDIAINEVKNQDKNAEVIFPSKKIESKPNRFIAIIETNNSKDFGNKIENKVKESFMNIANRIFSENFPDKPKPINFDKQIKDFLEIYWVMQPFENNYESIYKEIEKTLGAIKNVRVFNQLEETGRKCSLCGKRNALFYKKMKKEKKPSYIQNNAIEIKKDIELNFGEGLCAVCFVKRFYENKSFPSTAAISSIDWVKKVSRGDLENYKKLFKNFDEQLYYEENLRQNYLKKYGYFLNDDELENAKNKLKEIYKKNGKPKKYYALIMLDGDNMGKWLSGEFLEDNTNLKEFHNKISESLGKYAENINEIVKEPKGKRIYAGGDDVMTFLNLDYLFDILIDLREKFPKFEKLGFTIKKGMKSSASAGVVIAHYKTPLSEVLKWVRKMEKEAKEKGNRNSLAIAVLKHSGEIHKTVYKWKIENEWSVEIMKELVEQLKDEKKGFSNTFIKALQEEFNRMEKIPEDKMLEIELQRLLNRSSKIRNNKNEKEKKISEWKEKIKELYLDLVDKDNFFSFLNVSDFIARED